MSSISKYNGSSAYGLKPLGIDTREMNGVYTPNQILQTNLNYSYDFAHPESYPGSGTTVTSLVNSYTGTVNGSPTFNSTTGAFEGDAVNDYILLSGWTRPLSWSCGVWFLLNDWSTPAVDTIYSLYDTRLTSGGQNGLRLTLRQTVSPDENFIRFRWVNSGTNQNIDILESTVGSTYFQNNQWYYLCWSRTGSTNITIWMSNPSTGVLDELANFTPVAGVMTTVMVNNTYGCGDQIGSFIDGDIAELHEYTTNLSLTDFQRNFNNTKKRYGY